ncbi:hypothetical protein [Chitinophaga ginsengisegetis]|nr:hypothetical protein [Chitinophaga ginsengisegetis]MDR6566938.1 hypothetical protein [Chitinophaga ginsengisegetis]MDR6646668.1 hypothetical protein [Chitinophaga ginsengisegetis]MDR6653018.1 hypothetical protein [Chitinophaga ginsengisegetis]
MFKYHHLDHCNNNGCGQEQPIAPAGKYKGAETRSGSNKGSGR